MSSTTYEMYETMFFVTRNFLQHNSHSKLRRKMKRIGYCTQIVRTSSLYAQWVKTVMRTFPSSAHLTNCTSTMKRRKNIPKKQRRLVQLSTPKKPWHLRLNSHIPDGSGHHQRGMQLTLFKPRQVHDHAFTLSARLTYDDIRGFPADSRELCQFLHRCEYVSVIFNNLRNWNKPFRFMPEVRHTVDVRKKVLRLCFSQLSRRRKSSEQLGGRFCLSGHLCSPMKAQRWPKVDTRSYNPADTYACRIFWREVLAIWPSGLLFLASPYTKLRESVKETQSFSVLIHGKASENYLTDKK